MRAAAAPAGPPPTTSTSKASLAAIFSASRLRWSSLDLLEGHAALVEDFTVEVHGRHRHDLALLDFVLEQGAIDGHGWMRGLSTAARFSACTTSGQFWRTARRVGLEPVVAFQVLHLLDQLGGGLGRVPADLQQRQHQRGELVAHRQAGEGRWMSWPGVPRSKDGTRPCPSHAAATRLSRVCSSSSISRLGAVVGVRGDLDRAGHALQIGLQLRLQVGVNIGLLASRQTSVAPLYKVADQLGVG